MDHIQDYATTVRKYFASGDKRSVTKNSQILSIEQAADTIYYIAAGYVRIYSINERKEQYTHIIYGPGEIFPLTWLTQKQRSNVTYESLTDATIYSMPAKTMNSDLQHNIALTYGVMLQSIEQYRVYTSRVDNLEYKYASERLAYRLILLANRFGTTTDAGVAIGPPLTHQLLATSLNLSRESVSREMEKLTRRGLVVYDEARQISIPDIAELSKQLRVPLHQGLPTDRS